MSKYVITLDAKRCIACHSCEVHCKAKNRTPPGVKLGRLVSVGPVTLGGKPVMLTLYRPCFHCDRPRCVDVCPTKAMIRREEDGIVYVDQDLCVGCKLCIKACPWQVPQWDPAIRKVLKCDFCRDLVDLGEVPACVAGCTTHALSFGPPEQACDARHDPYGLAFPHGPSPL